MAASEMLENGVEIQNLDTLGLNPADVDFIKTLAGMTLDGGPAAMIRHSVRNPYGNGKLQWGKSEDETFIYTDLIINGRTIRFTCYISPDHIQKSTFEVGEIQQEEL